MSNEPRWPQDFPAAVDAAAGAACACGDASAGACGGARWVVMMVEESGGDYDYK